MTVDERPPDVDERGDVDQAPPYTVSDRRRVQPDPAGGEQLADAPAATVFMAECADNCTPGGVPFPAEELRDSWARSHRLATGHRVTLAQLTSDGETRISGYAGDPPAAAEQAPAPTARASARASAPVPPPTTPTHPRVGFVVGADGQPDLVCSIAPRAGAAWLLTAAHACMLGRGSLGVEQPHRAMYTGRVVPTPLGGWQVTIDGVYGAESTDYGKAIGMIFGVHTSDATAELIEDAAEAYVAEETGLPRERFTVVLLSDQPPAIG